MGQAAVDLPDPLQTPSAPALNNADDLLSQLAGDEIDRLLASSDEEPSTEPEAGASAQIAPEIDATVPLADGASESAPLEPALAAKVDDAELLRAATAPEPAQSSPDGPADAVQKDLDQLLTADPTAMPAPASADATPVDTRPAEPAQTEATVPTQASDPAATPVAEPQAEDATQASVAAVLDAALAGENSPPPNFLVRVLEFLNSPFAAMSDEAREAFGKIAIVTTVNAIAILLYVMLFRKH